MSLVTLCFLPMTGSCTFGIVRLYEVSNFLSAFNNLSYSDMYRLSYFLWYVNYDEFDFPFSLTLSPLPGITCTGSLSSVSDVGVLYYSIPGTKSSLFESWNIFMVYSGSIIFHSSHLISLFMMNPLVSVLYNLYVSLV